MPPGPAVRDTRRRKLRAACRRHRGLVKRCATPARASRAAQPRSGALKPIGRRCLERTGSRSLKVDAPKCARSLVPSVRRGAKSLWPARTKALGIVPALPVQPHGFVIWISMPPTENSRMYGAIFVRSAWPGQHLFNLLPLLRVRRLVHVRRSPLSCRGSAGQSVRWDALRNENWQKRQGKSRRR
jgi:hypothetical protein